MIRFICHYNINYVTIIYLITVCSDTLSLDDEALTNSMVSLQDVLLDDQDVIIDYDRLSADTNFSDEKSLGGDLTIGYTEDSENSSSSCHTPDSEKNNAEEHLKVIIRVVKNCNCFYFFSFLTHQISYHCY